jgi:transposase-like protein
MQMLYPFSGSIQQYMERVALRQEADRCRPPRCPQCESRQALVCHGFYTRTVEDMDESFVIRVRRYLCWNCRRTVSLLPEFVLPYLRFTTVVIAMFLKARFVALQTLKAAAQTARQPRMPYQRGQQWVDRFRHHAEAVSAALTGRLAPVEAPDFVTRAIKMLDGLGWIESHRFLFTALSIHLLGWPKFLAPAGIPVTIATANPARRQSPQNTCMDSKSPPA